MPIIRPGIQWVHGPDHIKENTYTPSYTQVVLKAGPNHFHITPDAIIVCAQLALSTPHPLSVPCVASFPKWFGSVPLLHSVYISM